MILSRVEIKMRNALIEHPNSWHKIIDNNIHSCENPQRLNLKEILTPNQLKVVDTAIREGYFTYPRKIRLEGLAKKIKTSPSTVCVHLQNVYKLIFLELYKENS